MQQTNSKKTIYWSLILMPVMAIGAIYWKIQHDKFPYVGKWAGPYYKREQALIIEVTPDKQMFMISKGPIGFIKKKCSYRMAGDAAIAQTIKRNVSTDPNNEHYIGDDLLYDLTHYRGLKKNGTYTYIAKHQITPKNNGSILEVTTFIQVLFEDQETGETVLPTTHESPSTYICRKVK
jgi:hypothetical protein